MPISGIGASQELMAGWKPGSHGGTYGGGSAVAAAAALATIEVILEEGLLKNATDRGVQLLRLLQDLQGQHSVLGDVRGMGLMVATEFTSGGKPDRDTAKSIQRACLDRNLLLLTCGTYENVIRWIPPLITTEEQIIAAVSIFKEALTEIAS